MWLPSLLRLCCCVFALAGFLAGAAAVQQTPPVETQQVAGEEAEQQVTGEQQESVEQGTVTPEPVPEGIELVEGGDYRYDSRGRRDPFVSLALGMNILAPEVRPPGLSGMLIQEVSLHGIVKTSEGYIAMIQGTDNKSYFARAGERLYDGTIDIIDSGKVVFLQEINDPLRIEKFHRIEKSLHPVEEGK